MKDKKDLIGIFLAAVTGASLLAAMIIRTFFSAIILPKLDVIALSVLSLVTLLLDYYIVGRVDRCYWKLMFYSLLIFGFFPWCACFTEPIIALKTGVLGMVIFTVFTFLFDSIIDRLSNGKASKIAPAITAFGIFLAMQAFMGII